MIFILILRQFIMIFIIKINQLRLGLHVLMNNGTENIGHVGRPHSRVQKNNETQSCLRFSGTRCDLCAYLGHNACMHAKQTRVMQA